MLRNSFLFLKKHGLLLFVFLLGFNVALFVPKAIVLAHGGDLSFIHACVKNNGNIRIVSATTDCGNSESALDWPATAGTAGGGGGPLGYEWVGSGLDDFANEGIDFIGYDFSDEYISVFTFVGGDMSGANFSSARLNRVSFGEVNLSNADFSSTDFEGNFVRVDLTNVDFSNMEAEYISFQEADVINANFTNAIIHSADFTVGADFTGTDLSTVTFGSEVEWNDTTCPDGTNSDDNGNTCIGHLTP